MRWGGALLVALIAGCDAEEFIGDCYPTRLCGFTVKQYVDPHCGALITQRWIEPGSCTADVMLGLQPATEARRPDNFQSNLGNKGHVGSVFSVGGTNDSYIEGIGYWKSSDRGARYNEGAGGASAMLCGNFNPTLYLSDQTSAKMRGTQDASKCTGTPFLHVADGESGPVVVGGNNAAVPTPFSPQEKEDYAYSVAAYECFALPAPLGGFIYAVIECGDTRCFPADATVTRADGSSARMADLRQGDEIISATADGKLSVDTVSLFSMAQSDVRATFMTVSTNGPLGEKQLTLTPDHRLPAGDSCCSNVVVASSLKAGHTVWVASADGTLAPQTVAEIALKIADGLYNPLMSHGGFPVVDGVVTAFNTIEMVQFDSYVVPVLERLCEATGTCNAVRRVVSGLECSVAQLRHFWREGQLSSASCKTSHFIDGTTCHGWSCREAGAPTSGAATSSRTAAACSSVSA